MKAYERLCNEFNIDYKTDFRQTQDKNHGMGTLYLWGVHRRYDYDWYPPYTSFTYGTTTHLGSIEQEHKNAWTTFILDKSEGFTRPGVERINESVRTYVWCVLGAQAQTRSNIMDQSTGFDAQKQYLSNLEDRISSAIDLPSSIKRYQDVLRYARSKVDFAIGHGLYMLPSNLQLQIGTITNYNNEILIAGDDEDLGKNKTINSKPAEVVVVPHKVAAPPPPPPTVHAPPKKEDIPDGDKSHANEMFALSVSLILGGLAFLYFRK